MEEEEAQCRLYLVDKDGRVCQYVASKARWYERNLRRTSSDYLTIPLKTNPPPYFFQ